MSFSRCHLGECGCDPAGGIVARWPHGGGRLILPLTTDKGFRANDPGNIRRRGAVFRIERRGTDFLARRISGVAIFPCEGSRDVESERALAAALERGDCDRVTRLYRRTICRTGAVGCAHRAGAWRIAESHAKDRCASDCQHSPGAYRGSVRPLQGRMGLRRNGHGHGARGPRGQA